MPPGSDVALGPGGSARLAAYFPGHLRISQFLSMVTSQQQRVSLSPGGLESWPRVTGHQ